MYDRAHIPFLERVLRAMKIPEVFVNVITTLYKNHWARLKVNGHVGTAFRRAQMASCKACRRHALCGSFMLNLFSGTSGAIRNYTDASSQAQWAATQ